MAVNNKVVKMNRHRRAGNLNIGMLIFGFVFVYIIFCVITYFKSDHISGYEVNMGSLSTANIYKGLILREEEVVTSQGDGYVNYFAREGQKTGANQLVYTIDGSGKLSELMASSGEDNTLDDNSLEELRQECLSFSNTFSSDHFDSVYDFKYSMEGTVLKLSSVNTLENISNLNSTGITNSINLFYAPASGVVIYSTDGYEDLTPQEVSADMFDETTYSRTSLINNDLIGQGDNVYKLCTSEDWNIVIPLTQEQAASLAEESYVEVKFLKNQETSWAAISVINNADGAYGVLSLNNSMITFCTERFVEIELVVKEDEGLKIPVSSIVEKSFYLVPKDYVLTGADGKKKQVLRQVYSEDGSVSSELVDVTIYNDADENYYIGEEPLSGGNVLLKESSSETYTVSKSGTLIGVYNINKGYADFRQITILYQNDDYAIVKSNTTYGLSVYDHIVLDASTVSEDDFIN